MAVSTCGNCNSTRFELREHSPSGSEFKLSFVQCASCGTVVGVMDYFNIGSMLEKHEKAIKAIAEKLGVYLGSGWR
jgi:hypothetical protein